MSCVRGRKALAGFKNLLKKKGQLTGKNSFLGVGGGEKKNLNKKRREMGGLGPQGGWENTHLLKDGGLVLP